MHAVKQAHPQRKERSRLHGRRAGGPHATWDSYSAGGRRALGREEARNISRGVGSFSLWTPVKANRSVASSNRPSGARDRSELSGKYTAVVLYAGQGQMPSTER